MVACFMHPQYGCAIKNGLQYQYRAVTVTITARAATMSLQVGNTRYDQITLAMLVFLGADS